jgi:hypothetical protein
LIASDTVPPISCTPKNPNCNALDVAEEGTYISCAANFGLSYLMKNGYKLLYDGVIYLTVSSSLLNGCYSSGLVSTLISFISSLTSILYTSFTSGYYKTGCTIIGLAYSIIEGSMTVGYTLMIGADSFTIINSS